MPKPPPEQKAKLADDPKLKAAVRRDFETTEASLRALAQMHGIRSENTIRRWRDNENWQRNTAAITARLVTRAVAIEPKQPLHVPPVPSEPYAPATPPPDSFASACGVTGPIPTPTKGGKRAKPELSPYPSLDEKQPRTPRAHAKTGGFADSGEDDVRSDPPCAHTLDGDATPPEPDPGASAASYKSVISARRARRDEEDRLSLSTSRALADIHATAIRKQVSLGDTMIETALSILTNIGVVTDPDADITARGHAIQRLTDVNRDKDTMAGLMKAAASVLQQGVAMQRKALAMDLRVEAPPDQSAGGTDMSKMLSSAPPEILQLFRDFLLTMTRARPDATVHADGERAKARGSLMPPMEPAAPPAAAAPPGDAP